MKKAIAILLIVFVSFAAAQNRVKSKRGSIDLTKAKGGSDAVCTAEFADELTVIRQEDAFALVRGACGQGWVPVDLVERVAAGPGDRALKLEGVDVVGWLDNPSAVFVLDQDAADFDGVDINRDFREYLQHTQDREQIERRNSEN